MIHHTCDRCKQMIDPRSDMRYVVRIEIEAAVDPHFEEYDSGSDHLTELSQLLEASDDYASAILDEEIYQRRRYDLCSACYRQYCKNPLARELNAPFGFSQN